MRLRSMPTLQVRLTECRPRREDMRRTGALGEWLCAGVLSARVWRQVEGCRQTQKVIFHSDGIRAAVCFASDIAGGEDVRGYGVAEKKAEYELVDCGVGGNI